MSLKIFSLHKKESVNFLNIQDKYAYKKDLSCIALSDGATQGYESGKWANILVNSYVQNPTNKLSLFINLLITASNRFNREINKKNINSKNEAIESLIKETQKKGSYCTFVGFEIQNDNVKVVSYGDSVFFHFREKKALKCIPTNESSSLDTYSNFLNTKIANDQGVFKPECFKSEELILEDDDILIMASDALSKYILDNQSCLEDFLQMQSFNEFVNYVEDRWDQNTLEEDDITILIYKHDQDEKIITIEPDDSFRFKEKIIKKPPIQHGHNRVPKINLLKYSLIFGVLVFGLILLFSSKYIFTKTVPGCMDPKAILYYDSLANKHVDDSCKWVLGCMDKLACNYDSLATQSKKDVCNFIQGDCDKCIRGEIIDNDADDDGVCDADERKGCQKKRACNYDSRATDPARCVFPEEGFDCDGNVLDDDSEKTGDDSEKTGDDSEKTGDDLEKTGDDSEKTGDDSKKTDDDSKKTDDDSEKKKKSQKNKDETGYPPQSQQNKLDNGLSNPPVDDDLQGPPGFKP